MDNESPNFVGDESHGFVPHPLPKAASKHLSEQAVTGMLKLVTEATKRNCPDALVDPADAQQYVLEEGPCLTPWVTCETVLVDVVGLDPRWTHRSARVGALETIASITIFMTSALHCCAGSGELPGSH